MTRPISHDGGSAQRSGLGRVARARLARAVTGEARFDRFTRGLYASDASIYRIEPVGVLFPRSAEEVRRTVEIAGELGTPVVPRGAGTSMSGQPIGPGVVVDTSRHLDRILELDPERRRALVQPGLVLDRLNALLAPHGLFFPVDVATSSRATIGGMAGNNSAGARSLRYGHMVEHVRGIEAVLAGGSRVWFGDMAGSGSGGPPGRGGSPGEGTWRWSGEAGPVPEGLSATIRALYERERGELERRIPDVPRHVAGYALHRLGRPSPRLSDLLVGSEGTLGFFTALELELQPLPRCRALGVCAFRSIRAALAAVPDIVALEPTAVELVDRTLLELAARIPAFRRTLQRLLSEDGGRAGPGARLPGALLIVEFVGAAPADPGRRLDALAAALPGEAREPLRAEAPELQQRIWDLRKAGLNIAMSMVEARKPIAFIEDCAIPLPRLPEWYDRLSAIIERHGTRAIWYAHASVGCLHVRPALDLSRESDVSRLRAIAEEAFGLARELGGSHSGEHGDGIVRSEFIEPMLGERLSAAFRDVKRAFDPEGRLNPGKIMDPPRMDDAALLKARRPARQIPTALDWSRWGGFAGAVGMCNDNGTCRKREPGVMCPSFRATADERHSTRGRANALRLALAGEVGWDAPELYEAMDLCIGCKGCRRECPTGVDMARMKIEYLRRRRERERPSVRERLLAHLPRYAPWVARAPALANLRNRARPLARLGERLVGIAADRPLPAWAKRPFPALAPARGGADAVLFVDTFTRYFEPGNAGAAVRVLAAAGVRTGGPAGDRRPLCCGRTYLNVGLVEEARAELHRTVAALAPLVARGLPVVGLEPSCLLTLRDELPALLPGDEAAALAEAARTFSEFLAEDGRADRLCLAPLDAPRVRVHGHCHEKAFGADAATLEVLRRIPGLDVAAIPSGCCGMAGSFGYEREHAELSRRIAEIELLPHVRDLAADERLVANGTSCRHQIADLSPRRGDHVAVVLDQALA